jgi:hypothetical protein
MVGGCGASLVDMNIGAVDQYGLARFADLFHLLNT